MHVESIWVRRIGDNVQVLFESLGTWYLAIEEPVDSSFSHIAEHPALEAAPVDGVAGNPYMRGGREWVTAVVEERKMESFVGPYANLLHASLLDIARRESDIAAAIGGVTPSGADEHAARKALDSLKAEFGNIKIRSESIAAHPERPLPEEDAKALDPHTGWAFCRVHE